MNNIAERLSHLERAIVEILETSRSRKSCDSVNENIDDLKSWIKDYFSPEDEADKKIKEEAHYKIDAIYKTICEADEKKSPKSRKRKSVNKKLD